jgi:hypothetical protein
VVAWVRETSAARPSWPPAGSRRSVRRARAGRELAARRRRRRRPRGRDRCRRPGDAAVEPRALERGRLRRRDGLGRGRRAVRRGAAVVTRRVQRRPRPRRGARRLGAGRAPSRRRESSHALRARPGGGELHGGGALAAAFQRGAGGRDPGRRRRPRGLARRRRRRPRRRPGGHTCRPGRFGAPATVATPRLFYPEVSLDELFDPAFYLILSRPPLDSGSARLSAAIAPDGRALVSWTGAAGRGSLVAAAPHSALGRLGGGFEPAQRLGGPLRSAEDVVPLFLADGRAAVAWTDQAHRGLGRLHLAFESAPEPASTAVRLRLRARRTQRLFPGQPPRVTAVCDRPCDLRASVGGRFGPGESRSDTNLAGGARRLDLGVVEGLRRGPARPVSVVVTAGAPGGRRTVVRRLRLRVSLRKAPPMRRPLSVRARRRGGSISVTWRTAGPARRQRSSSRPAWASSKIRAQRSFATAAAASGSRRRCVRSARTTSTGSSWCRSGATAGSAPPARCASASTGPNAGRSPRA